MEIRLLDKNEEKIIKQCQKLAKQHYLENLVLLGDLYPPCIHLTKVYGLFSSKNKLKNFFVIFEGFKEPSVVLPVKLESNQYSKIMEFLSEILPRNFFFLSLELLEENLTDYFHVKNFHTDFCMTITSLKDIPLPTSPYLKEAKKQDFERIDVFYKSIGTLPWHATQMNSGFYHYIEMSDQIVACGGTHFETPRLAQLGNIYVLEEFRRQQFGFILTTAITKKVLAKKEMATLFVNQHNIPALNLYKKLGYTFFKPANLFFCEK